MSESEKVLRRKQQRRENRSRVRQDQFIADYIYHKYFDIYSEAAQFYNGLNQKYPTKYDLRKTAEYRMWKIQTTGQTISRKLSKPVHSNIQSPIRIHPQTQMTIIYDEDQPPSPEQSEDPAPSPEQSEDPASSPEQSEDPAPSPKTPYVDNMQLKIPLLKPPAKHPSVTTKTLQIITEEVMEEGVPFEPSLCEEIDPEVLDKIINELRTEQDLQNIFTNIEQQIEFEQLGMNIDMSEDNRLEKELENWEIW